MYKEVMTEMISLLEFPLVEILWMVINNKFWQRPDSNHLQADIHLGLVLAKILDFNMLL